MADGDCIVFMSSIAATRPIANLSAYCVSKAAVEMLAKCTALELAPRGIRSVCIAPSTVETNFHRAAGMSDERAAAYYTASKSTHPLGRVGTPGEQTRQLLESSAYSKRGEVVLFLSGTRILLTAALASLRSDSLLSRCCCIDLLSEGTDSTHKLASVLLCIAVHRHIGGPGQRSYHLLLLLQCVDCCFYFAHRRHSRDYSVRCGPEEGGVDDGERDHGGRRAAPHEYHCAATLGTTQVMVPWPEMVAKFNEVQQFWYLKSMVGWNGWEWEFSSSVRRARYQSAFSDAAE